MNMHRGPSDISIGVDFDNTVVCYNQVFYHVANDWKLIPSHLSQSKEVIRNYLRQKNMERKWVELQGHVYGRCMDRANPYPHVLKFFNTCYSNGIQVSIISHKTRRSFGNLPIDLQESLPSYNLHQAAFGWISKYKLDQVVSEIYFEPTRLDKLNRIRQVKCTHFIDDLPDFLSESGFPTYVKRIHFDPDCSSVEHQFQRINSWAEAIQWIELL